MTEPEDNRSTPAKVQLGRRLFHEVKLSSTGEVSCNTCHDLQHAGVDPREQGGTAIPTSLGVTGSPTRRNAPTVFNTAFSATLFWDGRSPTLEAQIREHLVDPDAMAMKNEAAVVSALASDPSYAQAFADAFGTTPTPVTVENVSRAIASFERKLVTPSRLDAFLTGKMTAMTPQELHGLEVFFDVGCLTCHGGPTLGGIQYQKLGTVKPWPDLDDVGRFAITQVEEDRFAFRVAPLREVTRTGPYLHNGSISDLTEVVRRMVEHQSPRGRATEEEIVAMVAFLGALEGEAPSDLIAPP